MVDYNNFYIRTFIRVLKNNKCYTKSIKQQIKEELIPLINADCNILPHRFTDIMLFSEINVYNDIIKYKVRKEYIDLIIVNFISDLNKILINNNIDVTLKKDDDFIYKLLIGEFVSALTLQVKLQYVVKIYCKINDCLYKRTYDD